MSEHWAFCDRCHRWFYGGRQVVDSADLRCPVCDASPSTVTKRPTGAASAAS